MVSRKVRSRMEPGGAELGSCGQGVWKGMGNRCATGERPEHKAGTQGPGQGLMESQGKGSHWEESWARGLLRLSQEVMFTAMLTPHLPPG